jgi:hypothetical protein
MTTWSMPIACWIPKATNTHSEYVIHIAFQLQQWLHARASMSRCTNFACLIDLWFVWLYCKCVCVCRGTALFKANLAATHAHTHTHTFRFHGIMTQAGLRPILLHGHTQWLYHMQTACAVLQGVGLWGKGKRPLQRQLSYCSCHTQLTWLSLHCWTVKMTQSNRYSGKRRDTSPPINDQYACITRKVTNSTFKKYVFCKVTQYT